MLLQVSEAKPRGSRAVKAEAALLSPPSADAARLGSNTNSDASISRLSLPAGSVLPGLAPSSSGYGAMTLSETVLAAAAFIMCPADVSSSAQLPWSHAQPPGGAHPPLPAFPAAGMHAQGGYSSAQPAVGGPAGLAPWGIGHGVVFPGTMHLPLPAYPAAGVQTGPWHVSPQAGTWHESTGTAPFAVRPISSHTVSLEGQAMGSLAWPPAYTVGEVFGASGGTGGSSSSSDTSPRLDAAGSLLPNAAGNLQQYLNEGLALCSAPPLAAIDDEFADATCAQLALLEDLPQAMPAACWSPTTQGLMEAAACGWDTDTSLPTDYFADAVSSPAGYDSLGGSGICPSYAPCAVNPQTAAPVVAAPPATDAAALSCPTGQEPLLPVPILPLPLPLSLPALPPQMPSAEPQVAEVGLAAKAARLQAASGSDLDRIMAALVRANSCALASLLPQPGVPAGETMRYLGSLRDADSTRRR